MPLRRSFLRTGVRCSVSFIGRLVGGFKELAQPASEAVGARCARGVGDRGDRERLQIQALDQDPFDGVVAVRAVVVGAAAGGDGPLAGKFLEVGDDGLDGPQHAQRVVLIEDAADVVQDVGIDSGGAVFPVGAAALTELGALFGQVTRERATRALAPTRVRGDPDVVAVERDRFRRGAQPHRLADEAPWHRVQAAAEFDVAVAVHVRLLPDHRLESRRGQRDQCGPVVPLEGVGGPLAGGAVDPLVGGLRGPPLQRLGGVADVAALQGRQELRRR